MKQKIIILITILLLLISGCQSKDTDSSVTKEKEGTKTTDGKSVQTQENQNEQSKATEIKTTRDTKSSSECLTGRIADFSLYEVFPAQKNFTWYYTGNIDYGRYETIVNVQETLTNQNAKHIFVEGEERDPSGGEAGDLSFVKKYKITDNSIELVSHDNAFVILKGPLQVGNNWNQLWLHDYYGLINTKTTITDVTDKTITTELIPLKLKEDGVEKNFKIISQYEVGKGIISTNTIYSSEGEESKDTDEFSIWLSKTSRTPPKRFVSRYIEPREDLKDFYLHENMWYRSIITKYNQWIRREKDKINDEKIFAKYKELLQSLSDKDIKSISIAREIGVYYCSFMDKTDPIIGLFEEFYQGTIEKLNEKLGWGNQDFYEEADRIFYYDEQEMTFKNKLEIDDPVLTAKAIIFYENGISVGYEEGNPFLCQSFDYMINNFYDVASDAMKDYLNIKEWQHLNTPLFSDASLTVSYAELANHIIKLEEFYRKYPNATKAKWAREEAKYLFEIYVVPMNYMINTKKYWNGVLLDDVRKSYEEFIKNNQQSDYRRIVEGILNNLKQNNFMYNEELDEFLKKEGFTPTMSEEFSNRINEENNQLVDLESILSREVESSYKMADEIETITVENGKELLNAIGSNRRILIEAGKHILPSSFSTEVVNVIDGEVTIKNVKNLIIEGLGEVPVTLQSDSYGYVFSFPDAEDISLINLRLGHMNEYCKAGVVKFGGKNITIDRCILFGCGEWGIATSSAENTHVINTVISDCFTQAVQLYESKKIIFNNCIFTRNGQNVVEIEGCEDVLFKQVDIVYNHIEGYNQASAIFKINKSSNIVVESCNIDGNRSENIKEGDSELKFKE